MIVYMRTISCYGSFLYSCDSIPEDHLLLWKFSVCDSIPEDHLLLGKSSVQL